MRAGTRAVDRILASWVLGEIGGADARAELLAHLATYGVACSVLPRGGYGRDYVTRDERRWESVVLDTVTDVSPDSTWLACEPIVDGTGNGLLVLVGSASSDASVRDELPAAARVWSMTFDREQRELEGRELTHRLRNLSMVLVANLEHATVRLAEIPGCPEELKETLEEAQSASRKLHEPIERLGGIVRQRGL